MVDEFTRYTANAAISTKTIAANILINQWIAIFGSPKTIFSDNGGEFIEEQFVKICHQFNRKIITTTSESPWHQFQVKEDIACEYDIAISRVLCAKNALKKQWF